jgi:hypothetical protein
MKTIKEYKQLAKEFNACPGDYERLAFLKAHRDKFIVMLDNDSSHVDFKIPEDMDEDEVEIIGNIRLDSFDNYHYWSDGVLILFAFAGIDADCV